MGSDPNTETRTGHLENRNGRLETEDAATAVQVTLGASPREDTGGFRPISEHRVRGGAGWKRAILRDRYRDAELPLITVDLQGSNRFGRKSRKNRQVGRRGMRSMIPSEVNYPSLSTVRRRLLTYYRPEIYSIAENKEING